MVKIRTLLRGIIIEYISKLIYTIIINWGKNYFRKFLKEFFVYDYF